MFRLDLIFPLLIWVNLVNVNPNIVYCNTDVFLRFVAGKRNQETEGHTFAFIYENTNAFLSYQGKKSPVRVF